MTTTERRGRRYRPAAATVLVVAVVAAAVALGSLSTRAAPQCGPVWDVGCHEARYRHLATEVDVAAAFTEFRRDYERSSAVRSNCHLLAHAIGRAAGDRYGAVATAYGQGEAFCGSGYYHGAMEAIIARAGAGSVFTDPDALCADLGGETRYGAHHRNCAHGLGHGFMGLVDHDLHRALAACDRLGDPWEADHCHGGVFMQNVLDSDDPHHGANASVRPDEPLYPCTEVADRYKRRCYERQTAYALRLSGVDFAAVFELCARVAGAFAPTCYEGLGRNAAAHRIQLEPTPEARTASARAVCELGPGDDARRHCVVAVAETFVRYYHDDAIARAFCAGLDPTTSASCLDHVGRFYREFADR